MFHGLKNLIKVSHVNIDSMIFRLHYTFTVMAGLVGLFINCNHKIDSMLVMLEIPLTVFVLKTYQIDRVKDVFNAYIGEFIASIYIIL